MLTLKGMDFSPPCNKVRFVLNYLNLDFQFDRINLAKGEGQTPEYLKLNPTGKIPVLVDGDFSVWESNAIIKYLARKQKSPIYPDDWKQQTAVDQWTDFASQHVATAMGKLTYNIFIAPRLGVEPDKNSMEEGRKFLKRFIPIIDAQLSKSKYLIGDSLSIADFAMLAALDPAEACGVDLSAYPNVAKWYAGLQAQLFYKKCYNSYTEMVLAMKK